MPALFEKLNLKLQREILVINAPRSFAKKYQCEFSCDTGWDVLRSAGFDSVRAVAIDEEWSALQYRRVEFIKVGR